MNEYIRVKTLLGHKGLPFSIECLQSFVQYATSKIWLTILEDGTLTSEDKQQLAMALPQSNIIEKVACEAIVMEKLAAYPACLHFRKTVIYARKIFDLMLYDNEDALYIDSDILFVKKFELPLFTDSPVFMHDSINGYSFKPSEFSGIPFPIYPKINSGFFFFPIQQFDLTYMDTLLANEIVQKGYSRNVAWLEQTVWSFLASRNTNLYYFNSKQVAMATEKTQVTDQTICVHLVSTFRGQFEAIKQQVAHPATVQAAIPIRLTPAKRLLKVHHFYFDRIVRKLRRYWA